MPERALRVVLASPWAYPFHGHGGLQIYIFELARWLQRRGHEATIVTSGLGLQSPEAATFEEVPYRFVGPPVGEDYRNSVAPPGLVPPAPPFRAASRLRRLASGAPSYFAFSHHLARWLDVQRFDVLHAFKLSPLAYLLRLRRRPVVIQNFAYEEFFLPNWKSRVGMLPVRLGIALADRLANRVLCQGPLNAADVRAVSWARPARMRTLPNAVDVAALTGVTREVARAALGWSDGTLVLLTVNRLAPDKRVEDGVEVLRRVRAAGLDARLAVVGAGPCEGQILARAAEAGLADRVRIFRNATRDELVTMYRGSDLYLNPAETRYALLSVLEALAAGVPVVTYRRQEDLVVDGVNGFVVGRFDPAAMAEAVLRCCAAEALPRLRAAAAGSVRGYDWEDIVDLAIRIYREAIAAESRGALAGAYP